MDDMDSFAFRVFIVVVFGGLGVTTLACLGIAIALWRRNLDVPKSSRPNSPATSTPAPYRPR